MDRGHLFRPLHLDRLLDIDWGVYRVELSFMDQTWVFKQEEFLTDWFFFRFGIFLSEYFLFCKMHFSLFARLGPTHHFLLVGQIIYTKLLSDNCKELRVFYFFMSRRLLRKTIRLGLFWKLGLFHETLSRVKDWVLDLLVDLNFNLLRSLQLDRQPADF